MRIYSFIPPAPFLFGELHPHSCLQLQNCQVHTAPHPLVRGCVWPDLDLPPTSTSWELTKRDNLCLVARLRGWDWEHDDLTEQVCRKTCEKECKWKLEERLKETWVLVSSDPGNPVISLPFPFAQVSSGYISVVCVLSCFSHSWLFATAWTVAFRGPLSLGFSWQEYWRGLPFPSPGDLPNAGMEAVSLTPAALPAQSLPLVPLGSTSVTCLQRSYFSCTLS